MKQWQNRCERVFSKQLLTTKNDNQETDCVAQRGEQHLGRTGRKVGVKLSLHNQRKTKDRPAANPDNMSAQDLRSSSLSPSALIVSWIRAALGRLCDSTSFLCWSDKRSRVCTLLAN